MFLLILETGDKGARHIHTLNSIMFLLIHLLHLHENLIGNNFKFHYVSINSTGVFV